MAEIADYVRTFDACFPTAVILAVQGRCASFDEDTGELTLTNVPEPEEGQDPVYYKDIANVLDGQHRIEGLRGFNDRSIEVADQQQAQQHFRIDGRPVGL